MDNSTAVTLYIPRIGDVIGLRPGHPHARYFSESANKWRVTGHMRRHVFRPKTEIDHIIKDMLNQIFAEGKEATDTRLEWCAPEVAQVVTGYAVSGCVYPIRDVVVLYRLKGAERLIADEIRQSMRNWGQVL